MIENHEGGLPLTNISLKFCRPVSTVSTFLKDIEHIRAVAIGRMNSQIMIMKKCEGPISDMKKLLARWMMDCIEEDQIQKKARDFYQDMERELNWEEGAFSAH